MNHTNEIRFIFPNHNYLKKWFYPIASRNFSISMIYSKNGKFILCARVINFESSYVRSDVGKPKALEEQKRKKFLNE